jgi:hypothetical protein
MTYGLIAICPYFSRVDSQAWNGRARSEFSLRCIGPPRSSSESGGSEAIGVVGAPTRHPSPVTRHPSPVTRHPSPVTRHPSPVTRHPSPVTRHRHSSLATRHSPLATRHSPLATRHSPLATRHSPLATRHSPLATRHSPLATRHSPLATRHSPLATRHSPLKRLLQISSQLGHGETLTDFTDRRILDFGNEIGISQNPPRARRPPTRAKITCLIRSCIPRSLQARGK